jgi:hypothetical protein
MWCQTATSRLTEGLLASVSEVLSTLTAMEQTETVERRRRAEAGPRAARHIPSGGYKTRSGAIEVASIDADALMKDACAVLRTDEPSILLAAIDAGTMVAVMSDQAFWEIGWMSAPTARGQEVDDGDLRGLVTVDYLARIPVVATGKTSSSIPGDAFNGRAEGDANAGYWLPSVTDVRDPKDIAHVQVAQLVSATVVYSHDRHLRGPGHAPGSRPEFDQRVQDLGVVTTQRQHESNAAQLISLAAEGTNWAMNRTASLAGIRRGMAWTALGVATTAAVLWTFAESRRRQRFVEAFRPVVASIGEAYALETQARSALGDARLLTPTDPDRLEVRVASHLVRNPDSTMAALAQGLHLSTAERRELSVLLQTHPSFEKVSGWGWAAGRIRDALETEPSRTWLPRARPVD